MRERFKAYVDLTRLHFSFVWPLLFCSGLLLASMQYGGISVWFTIKVALIGFFGFEAGMILNDYVDRDLDTLDVEAQLTTYWRPFDTRPLITGAIAPHSAFLLYLFFASISLLFILTLPYPHYLYLVGIFVYGYSLEYFYQVKKRTQTWPVAQLLGRTDFTLFPVAGYLTFGHPDLTALRYFAFFYPFALAHLGVNDLADKKNDEARGMKTITVLYGEQGTAYWILGFTLLHNLLTPFFLWQLGLIGVAGSLFAFTLLITGTSLILKDPTPSNGLRALPLFHSSLLVYILTIFLAFFF